MATASYPSKIITWTDKIDGKKEDASFGDDVLAEDINNAYAEIIAIETELNSTKDRITTLELPQFKTVTSVSNVYTLDLSLLQDFALEITNTTGKVIVLSNIPTSDVISVGIKLKFTAVANITYPSGITWINTILPTIGKTFYILLISYDNGTTWTASSYSV